MLVVVDTLPAATLGSYGNTRPTSPVIDRLAEQGALFDRTYAPSNWTVPATASLLTSLYPSEHGAGLTGTMRHLSGKTSPNKLTESSLTLAEVAAQHGLETALFSANPYLSAGMKQGYQAHVIRRMPANELNDLAIEWLQGLEANRFLIHLQYMDLHIPVEPPAEFASMFGPDSGDMTDPELKNWKFGRGKDSEGAEFEDYRQRRVALHDGAMRFIDFEIGRLLDVLEERGWLNDTLVVITSDHGEEFWQHSSDEYLLGGDPRSVYGIGHGHAMYEEVVRVPLVMSGPRIPAGCRSDSLISLVDVAPTVLEVMGLHVPSEMKGRSLVTILDGHDETDLHDRALLVESPAYGPDSTAIVSGRHKLIVRTDGHELLFDLVDDPLERTNLSADDPTTTTNLRTRMAGMISAPADGAEGERLEMDEETEEQLRALGYVE